MPSKFQTPRISVREAFYNAAGPVALSNRNLLQFAIPSYALILISNPGRLGGSFLEWFFIATGAYFATVAVLILARETVLAGPDRGSRPLLTTLALLLAGFARGFAVWGVGSAFELISPTELLYRLYAGPFFVFGAVATLAIYNASKDRHDVVIADLEQQKAALDSMRKNMHGQVAQQQAELLAKAQEILIPVVDQLRRGLRSQDLSKLAPKLRDTIEDVVRPLSHEIGRATSATEAALENASKGFAVRSRGRFPTKVSVGQMVVPSLTTFGSASVTLTVPATITNGWPMYTAVIAVLLCWLVTRAAQKLLRNWWVSPIAASFAVAAVMALTTIITGLTLNLVGLAVTSVTLMQYLTMLLLLALLGFAMQIARTQRHDAEVQMAKVLGELSVLTAQFRQELWLNRRRVASVIHGPIQSALYASAIRLSQEQVKSAAYIEAIEADIVGALKKLETIEEQESFDEVLNQIKTMWDGVIELNLPPLNTDWADRVRENPVATACFTSVIRESVSNAAKHGKATKVWVEVEQTEEHILQLKIVNNGVALENTLVPGFGSSILDEVSLGWRLYNTDNGATLEIKVPI
ncbi:hypothetical protein [Rhodoluna limnophila]|uniref:hypothetical protein n=1 Tax=Rhodoluna limnophila TaxID=232537 RepID=UPI001106E877|nr:hypothetical protein [Rhodoluna limnophila]